MHAAAANENPAHADVVSQRTVETVFGISPRHYLDLLRRDDAPAAIRVGKLRLVRRDAMLDYLARLDAEVRERVEDHEVDGADAVLAEIGCAPVRGRR